MPSERVQRRLERLLDQAEEAIEAQDWEAVAAASRAVLASDAENEDASTFLAMAIANGVAELETVREAPPAAVHARSVVEAAAIVEAAEAAAEPSDPHDDAEAVPTEFAGGRYRVLRFLGEGGKKRVFLAHDALLDRDIAFSLIKTEGLDDVGRERITREAQAMGRLTHQHIVAVFDIGEQTAPDGTRQPYLVQELMGGGDVEDLLADAGGALPLQQALDIALATARGLEFAHAQGVIHRDLKPGNVWLTADGVAKIGDLGLAVTLGQTRLTEHGMMVGTYGYMPPEQAVPGELTPQADLYSLGAMLYELVTGRTPFQGDTPTAVISQHLNTRPVAPSWHSDHCPPELEALILQLLEKAPQDRPASATDVIAALEAVDPEGVSVSHSDSGANPLDRLARGVFIGRREELDQLRTALDNALQGRGSVAMLVGEPGIGKTRTIQELETYARMRGANVYWGRTHESAGMPAYWPWLQVGRAWGAQQDFNSATTAAAVTNPELVRLFPELRQAIPSLPEPQEHRDTESSQFLLFDAYTQFVRAQSADTPWVIVLDDLHWADKPTLQLLQFMARELANMNVLVVGTYRDTDLVRTHPLSEALAELNREGGFRRVVLKGLDADEVAAYVRQRADVEPSRALLDRIYEETEGNPFFLSEVVNLLVQEATLDNDSVSDIALPDGVREALGRRLDRLSPKANELLQIAAVVGREFAYETLALLDDPGDEELLATLEEALAARVIEESDRPGRYRFSHALMEETLLGELNAARRIRLHGQVAEAFERRSGGPANFVKVLAHHYSESALLTPGHSHKAIGYLISAAEEAADAYAWPEASRLYGRALALIDEDPALSSPVETARVAAELGQAAVQAEQYRLAWRSLSRALDVYRAESETVRFSRLASKIGGGWAPLRRVLPLWREALDVASEADSDTRARLLGQLIGPFPGSAVSDEERSRWAAELRAIVREPVDGADHDLAWTLTLHDVASLVREGRLAEANELIDVSAVIPAPGRSVFLAQVRLASGDLDGAMEIARNHLAASRARRDRYIEVNQSGVLAGGHLLRGDLNSFRELDEAAGDTRTYFWSFERAYAAAVFEADLERALELLPQPEAVGGIEGQLIQVVAIRVGILYRAGMEEQARDEWRAAAENVAGTLNLLQTSQALGLLDEAGPATATSAFREHVHAQFLAEGAPGQDVALALLAPSSFQRILAAWQLSLGDVEGAASRIVRALTWCEQEGFQVEAGRCHQALAEVEERRGNPGVAREHLDAAGEVFSRRGIKLYLDQVIAKKEILKA